MQSARPIELALLACALVMLLAVPAGGAPVDPVSADPEHRLEWHFRRFTLWEYVATAAVAAGALYLELGTEQPETARWKSPVWFDASVREAALHGLRLWEKRITTDPVLGGYRPIPESDEARSLKALGLAVGDSLKAFLGRQPPPQLAALALKLADDTGVCFVPAARAAEVLELAKAKAAAEEAKCAAIDAGVPVPDLPGNA